MKGLSLYDIGLYFTVDRCHNLYVDDDQSGLLFGMLVEKRMLGRSYSDLAAEQTLDRRKTVCGRFTDRDVSIFVVERICGRLQCLYAAPCPHLAPGVEDSQKHRDGSSRFSVRTVFDFTASGKQSQRKDHDGKLDRFSGHQSPRSKGGRVS